MPLLWFASYPKSGNTWLRAFFANYVVDRPEPLPIQSLGDHVLSDTTKWPYKKVASQDIDTMADTDWFRLRPAAQAVMAAACKGPVPVKTHSVLGAHKGAPTINMDVSCGSIYVVRNPLDVLVSYADFIGEDISSCADIMLMPVAIAQRTEISAPAVQSSWSNHVESWTGLPPTHVHIMRYEDMKADPERSFAPIPGFFGLPTDAERLKRAIRHSSFGELARQEAETGFRERSQKQEKFFRRGETGGWRNVLSDDVVQRMIDGCGSMMRKFGYLDEAGNPI